jgi:hypothetical protein
MGYVIAAVILLLIVGAGITILMLNATRRQRQASAADSEYGGGTPGSDMPIMAADDKTPLGDTDQHAGEQTREGETVHRGRPASDGDEPAGPESERLANRSR